mmetsp:Transcript_4209/g.12034  ORF Transcript_4209/g.12034 Transcript_4209/m.12034 type:complete len:694 (-) Transcript_4209:64-2145(-)
MAFVPSKNIGNGIRRSPVFDDLVAVPFQKEPEIDTAVKAMKRSAERYKLSNCLGHRPIIDGDTRGDFVWTTYGKTYEDVVKLGRGLTSVFGLRSGKTGESQVRIGIYTSNRPEALESLLGAWSIRGVAVPLYDSLGANAVSYIIDHADLTTVLVERSKYQNLIKGKGSGTLKNVVLFEDPTEAERKAAADAGLRLSSYNDILKSGESATVDDVEATAEDWAYVMYTSGTTGDPKGVILSQRNILAASVGVLLGIQKDGSNFVFPSDVYISYLPMAHSFEVCMQICVICSGASIGYFSGDVKRVVTDDIPLLKPTLMAGVPRIYNRFYHRVMQMVEAKGRVARALFSVGFRTQAWCVSMGFRNPFWDWLLFNNVRKAFGGRMRVMATGAAPLPEELHHWLRVTLGIPICQGYGMTENAAAAMAQGLPYTKCGNVGGPLPCTEVKLVDTDDYKTTDTYPKTAEEFEKQVSFKGAFNPAMAGKRVERGEVCLRGLNIFQGYLKLPKETEEAVDADGWLHTGDIGQWEADGALRIVDRKKNIFKLAQGEYVSPESVEMAACSAKWIAQIWVYGSSFETCVVAMVVPDMDAIKAYKAEKGLTESNADVVARPEVKVMIFADLVATCRSAKLRSFEIPKDIAFETNVNDMGQGFTIEQDTLTPTFKLRRPQLYKKYKAAIDKMYADVKAKEEASGAQAL